MSNLDIACSARIPIGDAARGYTKGISAVDLDMDFGAEHAMPYEVLLCATLIGISTRFVRQDGVDQEWRIMQPLPDNPPPVHPYGPGTCGPSAADELVAALGGWSEPWMPPS